MSTVFEQSLPTSSLEPIPVESQSLSLAERLDGLTYEQIAVIDFLSRGLKKSEVAADRQAQVAEVVGLAEQTAEYLGAGTIHGATFTLLEVGLLVPDEEEITLARGKAAMLNDRQRRYVSSLMGGATYEQASQRLGLSDRSLRTYIYSEVNKLLDTHSLPETTRLAYAAGLRPGQGPSSPEGVEDVEQVPISLANVLNFVAWMYPKEHLNGLGEISEHEARVLVQMLSDEINGLIKEGNGSSKIMKAGAKNARDWLAGQSLFQVAESRGKTEGSIMLGLTGFAAKLGSRTAIDILRIAASTPEESEDRLAPGENTVLDVVTAIKRGLPDRKLLFSGDYENREREINEAELVTLLNVMHDRPMRIQKIARLMAGGDDNRQDTYEQVRDTLVDLASRGEIIDVGDGQYMSKEWVESDEPEAEVESITIEPTVEEPPSTARPVSYSRDYTRDKELYQRQTHGSFKAGVLDEMLKQAGIADDHAPRFGRKKRQR